MSKIKMWRAKEIYKRHNGVRSQVLAALEGELGMTGAGARTYFQQMWNSIHEEKVRRRARWDFLGDPMFWVRVALLLSVVPQIVKLLTL